VLEVGLGGRLDATNVIDRPVATGIASIGLDHQQFLGTTLAKVGAEKAGIAKPHVPLICLASPPEALTEIERVATERGAALLLEGRDWTIDPTLRPGLAGDHQIRNANLAWQMLRAQYRLQVPQATFASAIATATWPARFQRLADGPLTQGVPTWIDGAHNPDAATALAALLATRGPMHLVLGILANKDVEAIITSLAPHALSLTYVPVPDHEFHDPAMLAQHFGGTVAASLQTALDGLPAPRLVAGSLYLAGQALTLNRETPT
jgi:dihydrofolate synthase/folylpolyglutamate synthase